ncbi:hypothetical protein NLI96_g1832 [Meripilus lineatus]|uniref:Uncharacterized protein n=1 Tax=Meripilus lineatus TaxID=2056292 RepID=A0AAD5VBB7_9APHY|nr:hypothetical protein NLI96_g1832 [Physisporinus lineatus]
MASPQNPGSDTNAPADPSQPDASLQLSPPTTSGPPVPVHAPGPVESSSVDGSSPDTGLKAEEDPPKEDIKTDGNFLSVIISSLKQFFNPGGGQIFVLQFPGRFLEISEYAWDSESAGIYGQFIKPVAVNETEFRLADQMFDITDVTSGPKGINLSQVYEQLLNNLLPIFQDTGLAKQQNEIRKWLMKDVKAPAWVKDIVGKQKQNPDAPPVPNPVDTMSEAVTIPKASFAVPSRLSDEGTVNRIELSNALMMEYLESKQKWELERDAMIEEAMQYDVGSPESQKKLNSLTRKLAHITAVREAQLSAKYSDAVIRGFSHNVREYMGYMDMKSSAEFLQEAKDSLREAAMSSLDGSLKVYPVQMTPINWWQGLTTNFTLEDLTQNPDLIKEAIRSKSDQVDLLNKQLVALTFGTKGDVEKLQEKVTAAESRLNDARATLAKQYTTNVFSLAQTCIDRTGLLNKDQLTNVVRPYGIVGDVLGRLQTDMQNMAAAQQEVNGATRAWTDAAAALALADATDTRQQQEQIRLTIDSLKKDIAELTARYQALNPGGPIQPVPPPPSEEPKLDDVPILPGGPDQTSGGSRWQEITLHHQVESEYSSQRSESSASTSSSGCNLWFWSKSNSSSESSGSSDTKIEKSSDEVWVGFRATLVTVDRAGWFRPQFFQESKSYYHINPELKWTKWPEGVETMDQLKNGGTSNFHQLNQYLLPGYTIGFIICKDITIKISYSKTNVEDKKSNMSKSSQSSGGCLCWSYSNGSSSNQSDNSHSFQSAQDGCIIRIPGPQILGYIIQLTPNDTTDKMPDKLPDNFFIPDSEYDEILKDDRERAAEQAELLRLAEEAAAAPKTHLLYDQLDEILKKANISPDAMNSVHQAITRELGIVSQDAIPSSSS